MPRSFHTGSVLEVRRHGRFLRSAACRRGGPEQTPRLLRSAELRGRPTRPSAASRREAVVAGWTDDSSAVPLLRARGRAAGI